MASANNWLALEIPQFWEDVYHEPSDLEWSSWRTTFVHALRFTERNYPYLDYSQPKLLGMLRHYLGEMGRDLFDHFRFETLPEALKQFDKHFGLVEDAPILPVESMPINDFLDTLFADRSQRYLEQLMSETELNEPGPSTTAPSAFVSYPPPSVSLPHGDPAMWVPGTVSSVFEDYDLIQRPAPQFGLSDAFPSSISGGCGDDGLIYPVPTLDTVIPYQQPQIPPVEAPPPTEEVDEEMAFLRELSAASPVKAPPAPVHQDIEESAISSLLFAYDEVETTPLVEKVGAEQQQEAGPEILPPEVGEDAGEPWDQVAVRESVAEESDSLEEGKDDVEEVTGEMEEKTEDEIKFESPVVPRQTDAEQEQQHAPPPIAPAPPQSSLAPPTPEVKKRERRQKRRKPFLEAISHYVGTLQPVDCVIMVERCRPFSKDTRYMNYFKTEYLDKILCELNGGPCLATDFGRDNYTSLYSLHTYDWRKPDPPTTLVASTAFIKELNAALDTLSPFTAPPVPRNPSQQGTPAVPLMRAALRQFEALSRVRSRCLSPPPLLKVRRHLIILALSSCQDLAPLEAEAVGDAMGSCDVDGATGGGDDDKLLSNLRSLRVAVSIFSPVEYNKNLRKLANIVNLLTPEIRKDPSWPTVIYSPQLANVRLTSQSLGMTLRHGLSCVPSNTKRAAVLSGHVLPPPSASPSKTQQDLQQQQQQQPPLMTSTALTPRMPAGRPPGSSGVGDLEASPHRFPLSSMQLHASSATTTPHKQQQHQRTAFSGPNSIEPAASAAHHPSQLGQQPSMPMGGGGSGARLNAFMGPNSVPDASMIGGGCQPVNSPMAPPHPPQTTYQLVPPSSVESQSARSSSLQLGQQPMGTQYYSPMAPQSSFENEEDSNRSLQQAQQQQQMVPSPYGAVHTMEQQRIQQSPYQATPQPSPASATLIGGGYPPSNPPSVYPAASSGEVGPRYQGVPSPTPPAPPPSVVQPTVAMPPQQHHGQIPDSVCIWEGNICWRRQPIARIRLFCSSLFAPRISLPWGNLSNVPVQFEQIDFDTKWGRILMSQRLGDCAIPVQLDVTCATIDQESTVVGFLRQNTETSFAVGILSQSGWSNTPPSGGTFFIVLLATEEGRIVGLIPKEAEAFRFDVAVHQTQKRQQSRALAERQHQQLQQQQAYMAQHQQQFDMEMQQQQQQQGVGGQPSPNPYGSPSIAPAAPGTPNKMPRVAPPPAASAVSMAQAGGRVAPGGGVVGGGPMPAEMSQAQYFQQSQARQAAWQLQQHQRSYSMMQQQQQQQPMPQMLGSANQSTLHPMYGMVGGGAGGGGATPYPNQAQLQQQAVKRGGAGIGPSGPVATPQRHQLRDASGRFQSSQTASTSMPSSSQDASSYGAVVSSPYEMSATYGPMLATATQVAPQVRGAGGGVPRMQRALTVPRPYPQRPTTIGAGPSQGLVPLQQQQQQQPRMAAPPQQHFMMDQQQAMFDQSQMTYEMLMMPPNSNNPQPPNNMY